VSNAIIGGFIQSLRANAPVFGGRVAGAAEFYKGLRDYNTSMPLPSAYVLPLGQEAEPNVDWTGVLYQTIHKGIGVAVELDAQTDRRGQAPVMDLDTIEEQLFRSVLNLKIPGCNMARGAYFAGARYLDLDRARLWYQWEFVVDWLVTDRDGFQTDWPPLEAIDVALSLEDPPSVDADPGAALHIVLPQEGDP
jgi:hypothetical protein